LDRVEASSDAMVAGAILPAICLMALLLGTSARPLRRYLVASDSGGHSPQRQVFEAAFPEYPLDLRIASNALDAKTTLDHGTDLGLERFG